MLIIPVPLAWVAIFFLLLWLALTSMIRRLHDRNHSAWWAFAIAVPVLCWLWLLIECGLRPGLPPTDEERAEQAWTAVHRLHRRPWTRKRLLKLAGNALGCAVLAWFLYIWFFDTRPNPMPVFSDSVVDEESDTPDEPQSLPE